MSLIEKIEAGCDNFRTIDLEKLQVSVGMVILPRLLEMEMINRAIAWCKAQNPPIEDPELVNIQKDTFLLWKSLVDPNQPWKEVNGGRVPNVLFSTMEEMARKLTGEWLDWLSDQLLRFREEVSPFTAVKNIAELEALLKKIRKESETPERFINAFKVAYCARHGLLPTERRVREMTDDQWWLFYYSLPEHELAAALDSQLFNQLKKEK